MTSNASQIVNARRLPVHQRGVSIVELMVAVTIGIIISAGIIQLFQSNKKAYRLQESQNIVNENARFAVGQIQYHLRLAAHWGGVSTGELETHPSAEAKPITNDCGANWLIQNLGFEGYEGSADSPLDCIPDANYVDNSDVVVARFADPERWDGNCSGTPTTGTPGCVDDSAALFVRTAVGQRALIFQGDQLPDDAASDPAFAGLEPGIEATDVRNYFRYPNHPLAVAIYFVRPCANPGADGVCGGADDDAIPTLVRVVLNDDGDTLIEEDLVSGVEQMQVSYGVDYDGDLNADRYDTAIGITTAGAWDSVVTARITLLIREQSRDTTFEDDAAIEVGDIVGGGGISYDIPADDRQFRRRIYTTLVQVRNHTRA